MAAGHTTTAPNAAEVPGGADWSPQEIQEGPFSQAAHGQESRPGVPRGGCRAAETRY